MEKPRLRSLCLSLGASAFIALAAAVLMDQMASAGAERPDATHKSWMALGFAAFWAALNYLIHRSLDAIEVDLDFKPWKVRLAGFFISVALVFVTIILAPGSHAISLGGSLAFSWQAIVLLALLAILLQLALRSLADALAWSLRLLPTIRSQLMVLALLSTLLGGFGVAVVNELLIDAQSRTEPLTWLILLIGILAAGPLLWAFVAMTARSLTRRLETATRAIDRVGEGDMDVRIEAAGRDEVSTIAQAFNHMVTEVREKQFLERAFGCYLTDAVLDLLRQRGALRLAAERREATVLFADVRGFTALSEDLAPEDVLDLLNTCFEAMLPTLQSRDGYVDKLIGDAVMCIFGVPVGNDDHAARAIEAAQEMQAAMAALNAKEAFGAGRAVHIGIGLHTGPLVAGSLGSQARAQYTVIGDTVNVASRLCSAAAGGEIVLSGVTAKAAGQIEAGSREAIQVKGRSQRVDIVRLARPSG